MPLSKCGLEKNTTTDSFQVQAYYKPIHCSTTQSMLCYWHFYKSELKPFTGLIQTVFNPTKHNGYCTFYELSRFASVSATAFLTETLPAPVLCQEKHDELRQLTVSDHKGEETLSPQAGWKTH